MLGMPRVGTASILCCSVAVVPCRHGIDGRLAAGCTLFSITPYKFILEKLPRHQTSSKLLLVENILRDLFHLLLEIMKSFRIIKSRIIPVSSRWGVGISCWLFLSSFLPFPALQLQRFQIFKIIEISECFSCPSLCPLTPSTVTPTWQFFLSCWLFFLPRYESL